MNIGNVLENCTKGRINDMNSSWRVALLRDNSDAGIKGKETRQQGNINNFLAGSDHP